MLKQENRPLILACVVVLFLVGCLSGGDAPRGPDPDSNVEEPGLVPEQRSVRFSDSVLQVETTGRGGHPVVAAHLRSAPASGVGFWNASSGEFVEEPLGPGDIDLQDVIATDRGVSALILQAPPGGLPATPRLITWLTSGEVVQEDMSTVALERNLIIAPLQDRVITLTQVGLDSRAVGLKAGWPGEWELIPSPALGAGNFGLATSGDRVVLFGPNDEQGFSAWTATAGEWD